ncbi:hypothetical protein [Pseudomonas sp. 44 R 15]|uniref:hypothetical protein n=1 Tax=Pseudomonas sp. 44 R 15 TaxID=1844105 RepID=UPI00210ED2BA|nr:hypothetical protein [Pseudomonas sp. 44 R 15]
MDVVKIIDKVILSIMEPARPGKTLLRLGKLQAHCVTPVPSGKNLQYQRVGAASLQFNAPSKGFEALLTQYSASRTLETDNLRIKMQFKYAMTSQWRMSF